MPTLENRRQRDRDEIGLYLRLNISPPVVHPDLFSFIWQSQLAIELVEASHRNLLPNKRRSENLGDWLTTTRDG